MRVEMPCGRQRLPLDLPHQTRLIEPRPTPALADPAAAVAQALARPLGAPPLVELARGRRDACIVVSDITRPVPNQILLPPILESLAQAGLPPERVTILVATGMHRPNLGRELDELLGPHIPRRHRVVNHDCQDQAGLRTVAEIEGAPIEINRLFLEADLKILTGLIEPHTFAGFSGGGKSVLPGLASLRTMQFMHSYALIADPRLRSCALAENPFQQYVRRVARATGVDFIVNVLVDRRRALTGVFAGACELAHDQGCRAALAQNVVRLQEPADLVVTSGGGHPLDATFYQSIKGLVAAMEMSRPGASVIMVSGCAEGLGSEHFVSLLKAAPTPGHFHRRHAHPDNFALDQWGAQRYYQARSHFRRMVMFAPGLAEADFACLGMERAQDLQAAVDDLCRHAGRVVAAPEGPYVVGITG